MNTVEMIRNAQKAVIAARKHARKVIAAKCDLCQELQAELMELVEVSPEMLRRIGYKPHTIGTRNGETIELGRSLASLIREHEGKTRADQAREREAIDIESRVQNYAAQFQASGESADFQIEFAPVVPNMIRKLKNDRKSLI